MPLAPSLALSAREVLLPATPMGPAHTRVPFSWRSTSSPSRAASRSDPRLPTGVMRWRGSGFQSACAPSAISRSRSDELPRRADPRSLPDSPDEAAESPLAAGRAQEQMKTVTAARSVAQGSRLAGYRAVHRLVGEFFSAV